VENTLASIGAALDAQADWVEIDVKLTRDQVLVLLHDHTLHRIWDVPARITDLDLDELPDGIPTLRQALDYIHGKDTRLLIDVTGVPEGAASVQLVRDLSRLDEAAFTGDTAALAFVRAAAPAAIIAMSWESTELPDDDVLAAVRPDYFNQAHELLGKQTIDRMHKAGLKVSTYTVDEVGRMHWLSDNGVDAIISNRIDTLVGVLRGH
jgi:glycerophosphoryl diester phosphodiesterase